MYKLRVLDTKMVLEEGLMDVIIAFDKENMTEILQKSGTSFDEEVRRSNFTHEEVFILAFTEDYKLAGYLEYGPCRQNGEEIYITSMQIDRRYRQSLLISQLLLQAKRDLMRRSFTKLACNVHKENMAAASVYRKLGFTVEEVSGNDMLYSVSAGRDVLENRIIKRFAGRQKKTR